MVSSGDVLHVPSAARALRRGWAWHRLDTVCEGVFDCPHSTPEVTASGPLMVRTQDIRAGVFRTDQAAHVSEQTYRERTARIEPRAGDVLYSREGTYFGDAAEVPPGVRVCLGQRMVLIRPRSAKISARFLRYWLNSPLLRTHIEGHRDGSVAERLNLPTIRGLPVLVPPRGVQERIAGVLGALDDKIELNRQMNDTMDAMVRALFKSWFVDFDPVQAKIMGRRAPGVDDATAALFPDRLCDGVPRGWHVARLADVTSHVRRGFGPSYVDRGGVCVLNQKCIRDGRIDFSKARRHDSVRRPTNERDVRIGDVLVNSTGVGTLGRVAQVRRLTESTIVDSHVTIVRAKTTHLLASVLAVNLAGRQSEIEVLGEGSTGQTELSRERLRQLPVLVPRMDVQLAFDRRVTPLFDRIAVAELESLTLASIRDALVPRLLSGQLCAGDVERAGRTGGQCIPGMGASFSGTRSTDLAGIPGGRFG